MNRIALLAPILLLAGLLLAGLPARPASAKDASPKDDVVARLSVTVDPDDAGDVHLPGPFAVTPDGQQAVLQVPVAEGFFVLSGTDILHHFQVPADAGVRDVTVTSRLLVAGATPQDDRVSVDLFVFDFPARRRLDRLQSANPFLHTSNHDLAWRVAAGTELVGVFHTQTAATYPLWRRGQGLVPSSEQVGRARAGIGFGDERWIPLPDGSVDRWTRGRTENVVPPGGAMFVGGFADGTAALLAPGSDPMQLPEEIHLTLHRGGQPVGDVSLPAVSPSARGSRRLLTGSAVRIQGDRYYWLYLGYDYVEIRSRLREQES